MHAFEEVGDSVEQVIMKIRDHFKTESRADNVIAMRLHVETWDTPRMTRIRSLLNNDLLRF